MSPVQALPAAGAGYQARSIYRDPAYCLGDRSRGLRLTPRAVILAVTAAEPQPYGAVCIEAYPVPSRFRQFDVGVVTVRL